ncbi:MAG: hypothetical protein ABI644_02240 [Arenimonas sp.]
MAKSLATLLVEDGPGLSTDLAEQLVSQYGLSEAAARKQISRGCVGMKRLAHLVFNKGSRFIYLEKDYRSPWFWEKLIEALLKTNSAYSIAFAAIRERGAIPVRYFPIACGAPVKQLKHLSPDTILSNMKKAGVLEEKEIPGMGACIVLSKDASLQSFLDEAPRWRARLQTERIVLNAVRDWARNLGFASYDKIEIRDEKEKLPMVGTYFWDMAGPSFLAPLMTAGNANKPKPGFLICDVLLNVEISNHGIRPFVNKYATLTSLRKLGKCLYIILAESYVPEAFFFAKQRGLVPATIKSLFGSEVANGLKQLTDVLIDVGRGSVDPEKFNSLFEKIDKFEGAVSNIRGSLFEFLVAEAVRRNGNHVHMNFEIKNETGDKVEIDVIGVKDNIEIRFIECKGYNPKAQIDDEEIDKWIEKRIPIARRYALKTPGWKNATLVFELWATGKLSKNAQLKIAQASAQTKKYSIKLLGPEDILDRFLQLNDTKLTYVVSQHFLAPEVTSPKTVLL